MALGRGIAGLTTSALRVQVCRAFLPNQRRRWRVFLFCDVGPDLGQFRVEFKEVFLICG